VVRLIDRLRVVRRWGRFLSIAAAVALLPVVGLADDPCLKKPDLWLPPDGTPGLAGGGISVQETTGDVCQGGEVTITVTIDNLSCGDAGPFDVTVTYGGPTNLIGTKHVDGLPGCEYTVLTFVWDTTGVVPGEYEIVACADTGDTVDELNETNNCLTIETDLLVSPFTPLIEATKTTDEESYEPGSSIRYEIVLTNHGCDDQQDNPGHEFEDTLPAGLTATGYVSATSGTVALEAGSIVWDGAIPAGSSVTIVFEARIDPTIEDGTVICNQGVAYWDSDGDGTNDTQDPTDDPGTPTEDDATCITVEIGGEAPALSGTIDAPTLSEWGMVLLSSLFAFAFWRTVRRRRAAA
jgi:uncharacterized repeat protein (TIGR01451 family)